MNKFGEVLITILSVTIVVATWYSFDNKILQYTIWVILAIYGSLTYLYVASKIITKGRLKAEKEFNEQQKPKTDTEPKNPNFRIREV